MKPRVWLQELRDLLAITSYDGRQDALMRWEQRWLVDLHARQLVSPEFVGDSRVEVRDSRVDMLGRACEHVRSMLGRELGKMMVEPITGSSREHRWGGVPMIEVRGDVIAIRKEPKDDD